MKIKKCLAVITARGGSKGVPNKNLRPLNGIPLIEYPIRLAQACSFIDKIMLSTDSQAIREIGLKAGADAPFLRPAELGTDTAKQEDVILHLMNYCESIGEKYEYLCLLSPTTPLAQPKTLIEAFRDFDSRKEAEAMFSVLECDYSPLRCNTLRPDGFMKDWQDKKYIWANRQELPKFYRLSGLITISKWDAFKREKTFLHDKTLSYVVDHLESWDINTPLEFFIAEKILEKGFKNEQEIYDMLKNENVKVSQV